MPLHIQKTPGEIPLFWNKSVIFFANILSLFFGNETEAEVLTQEVGALPTYGSRLIPILNLMYKGKDNLLVLEREPDDLLLSYFQQQLDLSLPSIKLIAHETYKKVVDNAAHRDLALQDLFAFLRNHSAQWLDGYVTDDVLMRLSECVNKNVMSLYEGSKNGNNKLLLNRHIEEQGMPSFDTFEAENFEAVCLAVKSLQNKGYTFIVIKSQIGASGIGIMRFKADEFLSKSEVEINLPEFLFYEGACMVQGWLDESVKGVKYIGAPSVQLFCHDDHVCLYDVTDQILTSDSVHEGNVAPPMYQDEHPQLQDELLRQAEVAGRWLHAQGYRGTGSVDFQFIYRNGEPEVRVCEINARVTGATYPSLLARHFSPKGAWLMRNIRFHPPKKGREIVAALEGAGLLYHKGQEQGVLPFNFNPDAGNMVIKGQFLFLAKTPDVAYTLLDKMRLTRSLQGEYDRD